MLPVEFNGRFFGKLKGVSYLSKGDDVLIVTPVDTKFVAKVVSTPDSASIYSMSMNEKLVLQSGKMIIHAKKRSASAMKLSMDIDGSIIDIRIMKEIAVKPLVRELDASLN